MCSQDQVVQYALKLKLLISRYELHCNLDYFCSCHYVCIEEIYQFDRSSFKSIFDGGRVNKDLFRLGKCSLKPGISCE